MTDEGKAVGIIYLHFGKAFDSISHCILLENLAAHGLDRQIHPLLGNVLTGGLGPECG